jgi:hypothetical protein
MTHPFNYHEDLNFAGLFAFKVKNHLNQEVAKIGLIADLNLPGICVPQLLEKLLKKKKIPEHFQIKK